ncbi:unnamed protein product [Sphagnum balticum]
MREGFDPDVIKDYLKKRNTKDTSIVERVVRHMKAWSSREIVVRAFHSWQEYLSLKKNIKRALTKVFNIAGDWAKGAIALPYWGDERGEQAVEGEVYVGSGLRQDIGELLTEKDSLSIDLADKEHNLKLLLEDNLLREFPRPLSQRQLLGEVQEGLRSIEEIIRANKQIKEDLDQLRQKRQADLGLLHQYPKGGIQKSIRPAAQREELTRVDPPDSGTGK